MLISAPAEVGFGLSPSMGSRGRRRDSTTARPHPDDRAHASAGAWRTPSLARPSSPAPRCSPPCLALRFARGLAPHRPFPYRLLVVRVALELRTTDDRREGRVLFGCVLKDRLRDPQVDQCIHHISQLPNLHRNDLPFNRGGWLS